MSGHLPRSGGRYLFIAIGNAVSSGSVFRQLVLFFVEQSARNIFLFGVTAANESLVGLAVTLCVDRTPFDESAVDRVCTLELDVVLAEAVADTFVPLFATLQLNLGFTLRTCGGRSSLSRGW